LVLKRVPAPRPEWSSFLLGGIAPWAVAAWAMPPSKKSGNGGRMRRPNEN